MTLLTVIITFFSILELATTANESRSRRDEYILNQSLGSVIVSSRCNIPHSVNRLFKFAPAEI